MKIFAVNGSPRKKGNTATVLEHFLEGARSAGADTELIHLYDLQASGCRSCFACKLRGGASYGHCALKDDLTPVLAALEKADGLVLGSPVYFGNVTGAMRSFQERLCFPYLVYDRAQIGPRHGNGMKDASGKYISGLMNQVYFDVHAASVKRALYFTSPAVETYGVLRFGYRTP